MASKNEEMPSAKLRRQLRAKIRDQFEAMKIAPAKASERTGLSAAQVSRINNDHDAFSIDRLVNVAESVGIRVRLA